MLKVRSYQQLLQFSQRAIFYWGAHFLEPTCLPKNRIPFLQKHRILATMLMTQDVPNEEIISSFWENIYFELFSFSIKRAARRGCDILLTSLTMEKLRIFCFSFVLYSLSEKKKSRSCLSLHSFTTDSNSLYENYKAINSFPKYSLCRKRTLGLYVCSQSTEAAFNESRGVIFFAC